MNDQYTSENLFIYWYEKILTKWWEQVEGMVSLRTGVGKYMFGQYFQKVNLAILMNRYIFFITALEYSKPKNYFDDATQVKQQDLDCTLKGIPSSTFLINTLPSS